MALTASATRSSSARENVRGTQTNIQGVGVIASGSRVVSVVLIALLLAGCSGSPPSGRGC